jgi:polyisoprenoid-binding protein YceI
MKTLLITIITLFGAVHAHAQERYFTKTGTIQFFSKAALEDIEATNKTVTAVLDAKTGAMQFAVQMKGFAFKKALMQQHFNENYVESDKYPKAGFKGTITNNATVDYSKDGTYNVVVKGLLTLHGVTKEIEAPGTIKVSAGELTGKSSFAIQLSQFSIAIPALVKDKISNNISITVDLHLQPLKG